MTDAELVAEEWRAQRRQAEAIYAEIDRGWEQAGLMTPRMSQTDNYQAAYNALAVRLGPVFKNTDDLVWAYRSDNWPHLVHVASHCQRLASGGGHGLEHAELEREMQRVVLTKIRLAPGK